MSRQLKQPYRFGPFRFYPEERVLLCNDKNLGLPGRAMDVLLVLFERRGEPVSRAELLKAVGGTDATEMSNLYRAVSTLSDALKSCDGENEYVETLRESGYRFTTNVVEEPKVADLVTSEDTGTSQPAEDDRNQDRVEGETRKEGIGQPRPPEVLPLHRPYKNRAVAAVLTALAELAVLAVAVIYIRNLCEVSERPSVTVNADGSWTAVVPVIAEGVRLEKGGRRFEVRAGEEIIIDATGLVDVGRGLFNPNGDTSNPDPTMDSPIKDHVGGLEIWTGPDKNTKHYFIGSRQDHVIKVEESGVLTFRVIESLHGYCDKNNSGSFTVTVKRVRNPE